MAQLPEMKIKWSIKPTDVVLLHLAHRVRDDPNAGEEAHLLAAEVVRRFELEPPSFEFAYEAEAPSVVDAAMGPTMDDLMAQARLEAQAEREAEAEQEATASPQETESAE